MHGNELRKAGHAAAGIVRIRQSLQIDDHPARKGSGLVLLARAAADSGQAELFDAVAGQCVQALRSAPGHEVLFNTFTVREVRLRRGAQFLSCTYFYPCITILDRNRHRCWDGGALHTQSLPYSQPQPR
jgi:hypothetical protein